MTTQSGRQRAPKAFTKSVYFPTVSASFALRDPFGGRSRGALHFQKKQIIYFELYPHHGERKTNPICRGYLTFNCRNVKYVLNIYFTTVFKKVVKYVLK